MPDEDELPPKDDATVAETTGLALDRVVEQARQVLRARGLSELQIDEELQRPKRPDTEAYQPKGENRPED